jgi:hypothetical protein
VPGQKTDAAITPNIARDRPKRQFRGRIGTIVPVLSSGGKPSRCRLANFQFHAHPPLRIPAQMLRQSKCFDKARGDDGQVTELRKAFNQRLAK